MTRYYYDPDSNGCRAFVYGGCEGNGNNFATDDLCFRLCTGVVGCSCSPEMPDCDLGHCEMCSPTDPGLVDGTVCPSPGMGCYYNDYHPSLDSDQYKCRCREDEEGNLTWSCYWTMGY